MGTLFGTDGIRGVANQEPITAETALRVGRAVAQFFESEERHSIVIGRDTRISGSMLEAALAAGVCSMGLEVVQAGMMPTPAVAFMTVATGAAAGIVVSASHNPYSDNGIKVFGPDGFKLSEQTEEDLEELILSETPEDVSEAIRETGYITPVIDGDARYLAFLRSALSEKTDLKGLKIVIDCANGATYRVAPELLRELGARVEVLFAFPDGKNINEGCGSQHPEAAAEKVLEIGAHIGLAFDGDGDRVIAVDELGAVLTGDQVLAICAKHMKEKGPLKDDTVVSTVMSNLGLGKALEAFGIRHVKTGVGDRLVAEAMRREGAVLGGEDSGHTVFLDHHSTGDGILTALKLLEVMQQAGRPLSELKQVMTVYPQVLINVDVKRKPSLDSVPEVFDAIARAENELGGQGRVLVRYSGTQMQCRVMVEGPTAEQTEALGKQIAAVVKKQLG
jgi:phosphoglucosamine mutase